MNINVICFGKTDNNGYSELERYYQKKLSRFCKINIVSLREEITSDISKNMKNNEKLVEKYCLQEHHNILLDIQGQSYRSEDLADKVIDLNNSANVTIAFFIGPSDGFSAAFRTRFKAKISFGKLTMPHQLARITLLEQLYRSFKIINNEKYHK